MEGLDDLTKWEAGADPNNPIKATIIFDKTGITKEQVKTHVYLVWADMAHGSVTKPKHLKAFSTKPTDDSTPTTPRNQQRLKH
eukprot:11486470-Ditylum_brightwellii.AAC.1